MNRTLLLSSKKSLLSLGLLVLTSLGLQGCLKESVEAQDCSGTTYVHAAPVSAQAQLLFTAALFINKKNVSFLHQDSTDSEAIMATPPTSFTNDHTVSRAVFQGRQVLTLTPKTGAKGRYLFYVHGGGYGSNVGESNYTYFAKIIERTGATIVLPDYGLAPYYTYVKGYAFLQAAYDDLVARVGAQNVILMGDSAGGGFALGFVQKQLLEKGALPAQLILFSPWLDITTSNPDMANFNDPGLDAEVLQKTGLAWAGTGDRTFYQLSPINGPLKGLPPLSIFIGGREILMADVLKLQRLMKAECLPLNTYEYPQMFHVWAQIIPNSPEGKSALDQVATLINK